MVWDGSITIEFYTEGTFLITADGFDANAETVERSLEAYYDILHWPKYWAFWASRTAGNDDTVDVDFQGSMNGVLYANICATITDVTGTNPTESPVSYGPAVNGAGSDQLVKPILYIKFLITDIGLTNNLTLYALGVA